MRRPAMLRYNNWVSECADFLTITPAAGPSDKILVSWFKLLSISEEITTSLSFDDPGSTPSLSEPRVQYLVKSFEKRLADWKAGLDSTNSNGKT
jgi:hypothetical protein